MSAPSAPFPRRRRLVPEVVQTSAMDCGPACLAAILRGFGVDASYGRLREACQTDVDGTSIDTLEEIAGQLGLDASQVLIPVDHVLLAATDALPALAVARLPSGDNHFIVAWGHRAGRVQVMDPAVGRRWMTRDAFLDQLYVHEMRLPAEAWREWAASDDLRDPLAHRLRAVGAAAPSPTIERALSDPSWRGIAALDAATRMVQSVIDAGGLTAGAQAVALVEALATDADAVPDAYWSARPGEDETTVRARGAVMVHVAGRKATPPPASPELAAALSEPPARPWRALASAVVADGGVRMGALGLGLALAAAGTVGEAVLFRALYDVGRELSTLPQRLIAMVALLVMMVALALIEVPLSAGLLRLGRHVELRLRIGFLTKLPRLGLAYLRSRPRSDMAERSHALHQLRDLPNLGARLSRVICEILFTAAALCWLAPASTPLVAALVAAALIPPFVVQPVLAERELRLRTHAGGLSRFYLDALLGAIPARTHGIERMLRREHEGLLVAWTQAARDERRLAVVTAMVQATLSLGAAVALVMGFADRGGEPASVLLLTYWALAIPLAGQQLTAALRALPGQRNLTLRLLEPLAALDDEVAPTAGGGSGAVAVAFRGVTVAAAGHTILAEIELSIRPGEHVAIVGRSGAGKSTLLGLLQGWVRPSAGDVFVDGAVAARGTLAALRQTTAWVDPAIHLWNESLAENLAYGAPDVDVAAVIGAADLEPVLARLPEGLGTRLGEGGTLVSGGEGQRVRLGRALARGAPRLVLLDEPCRGLDRTARHRHLASARHRWRDATLLCVTHDIAEAATFARVIVVEGGRIVEDGAPDELATRVGSLYAAMLTEDAAVTRAWSHWERLVLDDGLLQRTAPEAEP